ALILVEDTSHSLRDYRDGIDYNYERLESINAKIQSINNLKKKYGPEIVNNLDYKEYISERLEIIENRTEVLDELEDKIKNIKNKYLKIAKKISKIRKEKAKVLER